MAGRTLRHHLDIPGRAPRQREDRLPGHGLSDDQDSFEGECVVITKVLYRVLIGSI